VQPLQPGPARRAGRSRCWGGVLRPPPPPMPPFRARPSRFAAATFVRVSAAWRSRAAAALCRVVWYCPRRARLPCAQPLHFPSSSGLRARACSLARLRTVTACACGWVSVARVRACACAGCVCPAPLSPASCVASRCLSQTRAAGVRAGSSSSSSSRCAPGASSGASPHCCAAAARTPLPVGAAAEECFPSACVACLRCVCTLGVCGSCPSLGSSGECAAGRAGSAACPCPWEWFPQPPTGRSHARQSRLVYISHSPDGCMSFRVYCVRLPCRDARATHARRQRQPAWPAHPRQARLGLQLHAGVVPNAVCVAALRPLRVRCTGLAYIQWVPCNARTCVIFTCCVGCVRLHCAACSRVCCARVLPICCVLCAPAAGREVCCTSAGRAAAAAVCRCLGTLHPAPQRLRRGQLGWRGRPHMRAGSHLVPLLVCLRVLVPPRRPVL
jgi:hypothetical protein